MVKIIQELRRREVFRTTGLYIGGAWIVLQVADIVLPAYDAPDWVFKTLITVAIVGLPIAVGFAWMFDLSAKGIELEVGVPDEQRVHRGRKGDLAVISVLLVALSGSLYINLTREPAVIEAVDPVSVLIADLDNQTGDAVFDGVIEQTLALGIEASSFITAYDRTTAGRILAGIDAESSLDAAGARLVSAREGIGIVVGGTLTVDGGEYELSVDLIDTSNGEVLADLDETADGKTEVLTAVAELARGLREALGDVNVDRSAEGEETFTTISLEAMDDYVKAQRLARDGKYGEAIGLYMSAVDKDPQFGRAWSGLALSADNLGNTDISEEAWEKALSLLEGMSERERYRTEGVYYSLVARNSKKAIENYETLVEKYPADDSGHNNLAVAYFMDLQFDKALVAGQKVLEIYPTKPMYHGNYALYAMYASDYEAATTAAAKTLEYNANYHKAYLPYAVAALVQGDIEAAQLAYENMATTGARGVSLANMGLADMALWRGDAAGAEEILVDGMQVDKAEANNRAIATKKMMRAYAMWRQGRDSGDVVAQILDSLAMSEGLAQVVPAALMYIELGMPQEAEKIAAQLGGQLERQQRAYSNMINALLLLGNGEDIAAIEMLHEAMELADVWLVRFYLGVAYTSAGHAAEAVSEFTICQDRLGEAYSLFLDDTPTFRYTAELDGRLAQARENMTAQQDHLLRRESTLVAD
jgi:tetratricopeptide (TPR) repeat protein